MRSAFVLVALLALGVAGCDGESSSSGVTPSATASSALDSWAFSGAITGTTSAAPVCGDSSSGQTVEVSGALPDGAFDLSFGAAGPGTFDFAVASSNVHADLRFSPEQQPGNPLAWQASPGEAGVSGTLSINTNGSGSLQATLAPSSASPGLTEPVTINGIWDCS